MTQPLILLPGLASDAALFHAQLRDLADVADVTVGDTLQDDSLPAMARRVLAGAPDRFALAGLSMGGYLALEIMRQAPQRVTRLALLDTSARADTPEQTKTREDAIATVAKVPYEKLAWASLARLVANDADEDVKQAVVDMAVRVGPDTYVRQQRAIMARPDSRPLLGEIAVPALVLVGEKDVLTPPELAREMAAAIPGATLVEIPGSGHLASMERPAAVSTALRDWLAR
jgi:pimeloyl-ACP methyl ester carboxylesterase